jgi:phosphoribosyl 1,2-cyclic phosphodiesterase
MDGPYPWPLKQRVRGDRGHLSNRQGAELLAASLSDNLQHLVLAHLSEHNNTVRHARSAATAVLDTSGVGGKVHLHVAVQRAAIAPIRVKSVSW